MKLYFTFILLLLSVFSSANVGVFTGTGHSIQLTETKSVQMVNEVVTIIPGRGPFLFDGTVAGMDQVRFDCVFTLKNLSDKEVTINAGFPLNSQFIDYAAKKGDKATEDLVADYNFIAQSDNQQYSVKFSPKDKGNKLQNLFLWDMKFAPNETKKLRVTYTMRISMTLFSTSKGREHEPYSKPWYRAYQGCILEHFGYVTETGNSWAGKIEKATFRIYVRGFEEYLKKRPSSIKRKPSKHEISPIVFREFSPQGWVADKKGFMTLEYKNYTPKSNLHFKYYFVALPKNEKAAKHFHDGAEEENFSSEDYQDLIDILKEFNGEKTGNKRIQSFVENQVWHTQEKTEKISKNVIDYFQKVKDSKSK